MLDAKYDQISGFNNCHPTNNAFIYASIDSCSYSLVNITKPPKCDDPPFESLGTCQKVEALQLPLMVMSGSHDLDEIHELGQIRLTSQTSLVNIISLSESSFLKDSIQSDVSPREYFHLL